MADLSIPDLPDDAYDELAARAERAGLPIEAYLRRELVALASRPANELLLDEVQRRKAAEGTRLSAAEILRLRDLDRP